MFYLRVLLPTLLLLNASGLSAQRAAFDCDSTYYPIGGVVSPILVEKGLVSSGGCEPVAYPCIAGGCTRGIKKYLARAVKMNGLADLNMRGTCWGLPYRPHFEETGLNCEPPYDYCSNYYCPEKYAQAIQMLVQLKAQLILRASSAWYRENGLVPHGDHRPQSNGPHLWGRSRQLILDINAAYDCAGLQRPIVQAGIFETVGDGVEKVAIPQDVILWLSREIKQLPEQERRRYMSPQGEARIGLHFRKNLMLQDSSEGGKDLIDIRKMEARLWLFFQAKIFLDFGYKSLHMGQYHFMNPPGSRGDHQSLWSLLQQIRTYAESIGSFVLIAGENLREPVAKLGDQLLFDYEMRALRARELSDPPVRGDVEACDMLPDLDYFAGTPCEGSNLPAFLDPCVVQGGPNGGTIIGTGGKHPLGCQIEQQPYLVYFDFGPGTAYYPDGQSEYGNRCRVPAYDYLGRASVSYPPSDYTQLVWGYDDHRWFGYELDRPCRNYWLGHYLCRRRQVLGPNGFLQIPGLIRVVRTENYCNLDHNEVLIDSAGRWYNTVSQSFDTIRQAGHVGLFFMADDSQLLQRTAAQLEAVPARYEVSAVCSTNFPTRSKKPGLLLHLRVREPDCSSSYTWEIWETGNKWSAYLEGAEVFCSPPNSGRYRIRLRQDNFGFSSASSEEQAGTRLQDTLINVDKRICPGRDGALHLFPNPTEESIQLKYNFQAESDYQLYIFDPRGKLLHSDTYRGLSQEAPLQVSLMPNWPPGLYTAALWSKGIPLGHGRFLRLAP